MVQTPKLLTVSQRRARVVLAAWNSGDLARLEAALDSPAAVPATTSLEEERMEMVAELESSLRDWLDRSSFKVNSGQGEIALLASLKLLRHLAGCEVPGSMLRSSTSNLQVGSYV